MIREIVLDTETTGLDPLEGHKIIEIAAIELIDHIKTEKNFHFFINPEREIPEASQKIHNISNEKVKDKPKFGEIYKKFLDFIKNDCLDLSYSKAKIDNLFAREVGDKVISAGESSILELNKVIALNSEMGIVAKDSSNILVKSYKAENVSLPICFTATPSAKRPTSGKDNLLLLSRANFKQAASSGSTPIILVLGLTDLT